MSTIEAVAESLTAKQEQFCYEYLIDFNATQAAIRAGYSKKTARQIGNNLLTKIDIQEYLATLKEERKARARKTADDIIREYERIGFSDITDVIHFNESGAAFPKSSDELDSDVSAAIESVEVVESQSGGEDAPITLRTKVKLHPKLPALAALAKHHGVCLDRSEVRHTGDVKISLVDYSKVLPDIKPPTKGKKNA